MALEVLPIDLDTQREELLDVLERNLAEISHAQRFDWLYRNHPCGSPRSWFLFDSSVNRVVGTASLFPRLLCVENQFISCGQVGDFAVDKAYRSLGPALMLQRATIQAVDRSDFGVCYDCPPHLLGMSTFRRLGMEENCVMHRYVRLIRTDRQFQKILGDGASSRSLAALGNMALRLLSQPHRVSGLEIGIHTERFGEEFTCLDRCQMNGIRSRRWAEDLNWRFRDDPLNRYTTLTARQKGELTGFAVFRIDGRDARLIDISGSIDAASSLLDGVVQSAQRSGVETLQAMISDRNPLSHVFQRLAFRFRSAHARVVAYSPATKMHLRSVLRNREKWVLTHADILA